MKNKYQEKSAQPKKDIFANISNIVQKIFWVFRTFAHLIYNIIEQAFRLLTFCFNLLVKLVSNPTTPCVVAILLFMLVSTIATMQWYAIGVWIGGLLGLKEVAGIGAGIAGVALGLGINVYQLAPILWRIRHDIAKAYVQLGIDVDNPAEGENPETRIENWVSADYGLLKVIRQISYGLETSLVIAYCSISAGFNFYSIMQAAISLILPEKCLELVASTISVLGLVQEQMAKNAEDDSPDDHVYL